MKCIVCGRPFDRYEKGKNRRGGGTIRIITRKSTAVTCSKNCTKKRARGGRNEYFEAYRKRPEVIAQQKIRSRKSYLKKKAEKLVKSKDL